MDRRTPVGKLSRRLGVALTSKASRIMEKKPYPPGMHGPEQRRGRTPSEFKRQLLEKQRLRAQYNIHEAHLQKYYKRAIRRMGNTPDLLVQELESRLDAVVLRAGFAKTIYQARQLVGHRHFTVNGKSVNIPSYQVRVDDVVGVRTQSRRIRAIVECFDSASSPDYIEIDKTDMTARLTRLPVRSEVPIICDVPMVVMYYSR
jgi:small subunit ribosomal protein S4